MEIKERVLEIIRSKASVRIEDIDYKDNLRDIGIDSIMLVELIIELEDCFNIQINDSDLNTESLRTINSLIELVESYYIN